MVDIIEKIYNSALKFLGPLSPEKTYEEIVKEANKLTGTKWGTIFLSSDEKLIKVFSTLPVELGAQPRKKGQTYKTFKTGKPSVLSSNKIDKGHPMYKKVEMIAFVPLHYNNKPYGVLNLFSNKKNTQQIKDNKSLRLFGTMASLAIKKAHLYAEKKEAIARRDLFLNIASHELKTPLTSIYVYSELLKKKFGESPDPEGKWSRRLYRETIRLTNLIGELLSVDLAKTGSLGYLFKACSLSQILKRALNETQLVYPEHSLVFRVSDENDPHTIKGDPEKLMQVAINILGNACKFSQPGSVVIMSLEKNKKDIVLMVEDHGKGIQKKSLERVFEIFYKANSVKEGMGIGLYLVKKIVEKHNGKIKITSQLNVGTKVEIRFPEFKI